MFVVRMCIYKILYNVTISHMSVWTKLNKIKLKQMKEPCCPSLNPCMLHWCGTMKNSNDEVDTCYKHYHTFMNRRKKKCKDNG